MINTITSRPLEAFAPAGVVRVPTRVSNRTTALNVGLFFAAHVPLSILMFRYKELATAHAVLTALVGTIWMLSKQHLERAAYVSAYITGAEVLWRMTDALVLWEFGKYSTAAILMMALLRAGQPKWPKTPLIYFLLLLPSAFLTLENLEWGLARKSLSFNLSGPLALMVCVWFFSNLRVSVEQLHRCFFALIGPVVGIASVTAFSTFSASALKFSEQSNKLTSGGFGPNQVSAILGLGVLLSIFILMDSRAGTALKVLMFGTMTVLGIQSAMTFSRGGLYAAAGGVVLASFYLIRDFNTRVRLILVVSIVFVITNYIVLPNLDTFTGGALSTRFQDTDPSGRDEIILADLEIWYENPIFGVGPGRGMRYRFEYVGWVAAHTEYSRLLAEHGIFGAAAFLLLLVMSVQAVRRARTVTGKALAASAIGWSLLFMMIDAMRLVAPAFAFGLSYAVIVQKAGLPSGPARTTPNKGSNVAGSRVRRRAGTSMTRSPRHRIALEGAASDSR